VPVHNGLQTCFALSAAICRDKLKTAKVKAMRMFWMIRPLTPVQTVVIEMA